MHYHIHKRHQRVDNNLSHQQNNTRSDHTLLHPQKRHESKPHTITSTVNTRVYHTLSHLQTPQESTTHYYIRKQHGSTINYTRIDHSLSHQLTVH